MAKTKGKKRLDEYRRKRDFRRTAEPSRTTASTSSGDLRFVVQKHAASRLHYDFRLEWEGMLKSWAVTKGPSLDPSDKRLAVRTEDHPLDYGDFEGRIPEGDYGGGTVMLWDRGRWEPLHDPVDGLKEGKLHFRLHGERMQGGWALVRMKSKGKEKRENWLLIKERDDLADEEANFLRGNKTSVASGRTMKQIRKEHSKTSEKAGTMKDSQPVERAGVYLTHSDKVLFPGQGLSKIDLADYYKAVAERMLPLIADRPLSLVRCPQGRGRKCFYQKHDTGGFPDAIASVEIEEKSGNKEGYFYIRDPGGLMAAVQMGTLEFHIWSARRDRIERPDRLVFDLDPDDGLGFGAVRDAAFLLRDRLSELGLCTVALVTGGKGVHVIAPLERRAGWDAVKAFAKGFAQRLAEEQPDDFTATMSKAKRRGKIFIDWLRNERGSTAIAPYSTRGRKGAPVATPVSWDELKSLKKANGFGLSEVVARLTSTDPWADLGKTRQSITRAMLEAVG